MSQLERAAGVMDRLRSPGGCPWDAAQTHRSLTRYLVEETYEVLEAIETADAVLLREELGDLLLQVLFHARIAAEATDGTAFTIEDVAADLVTKLERRHPHVFGDADPVHTPEQQNEAWERLKAAEKQRASAVDGVPLGQPALSLAAKLVARAERNGLGAVSAGASSAGPSVTADGPELEIGDRLMNVVRDAVASGVDPEGALRARALAYRDALLAAEA